MKKSGNIKSLIPAIALIFLFICFISLPLFQRGIPVTDDGEWMVIRLSAFYQSLAEGQFPTRFLGRLNHSFGYPVANFLYPGYLYIGSFLHLLGLSFVSCVKAVIISFLTLGSVSLFFWLRRFFRTKESLFGTLSFIVSPYLLYDIYVRGSVGEIVATGTFLFILFLTEAGWYMLLPAAIAFFLISHNTLAMIFLCVYVSYLFLRKKWGAFVPVILGGLTASFFWLPALAERSFVVFDRMTVANPFDYFSVSTMLLWWGLPSLLLAGYVAGLKEKIRSYERLFFIIVFFLSSFFVSALSTLFWKIPAFVSVIQFPYRFFSLWFIAVPWILAWFVQQKNKILWKYGTVCVVLGIGVIFSVLQIGDITYGVHPEGYYTTNEATTTVRDEYMPKWVIQKPQKREYERLAFFEGKGTIAVKKVSTQKIDVRILAKEDSIIQVNTVFYPGWGAMLDEKPVEIDYKNQLGVIRIHVPEGEHHLIVEFRETILRFVADGMTVLGLILSFVYAGYLLFLRRTHKSSMRLKER